MTSPHSTAHAHPQSHTCYNRSVAKHVLSLSPPVYPFLSVTISNEWEKNNNLRMRRAQSEVGKIHRRCANEQTHTPACGRGEKLSKQKSNAHRAHTSVQTQHDIRVCIHTGTEMDAHITKQKCPHTHKTIARCQYTCAQYHRQRDRAWHSKLSTYTVHIKTSAFEKRT